MTISGVPPRIQVVACAYYFEAGGGCLYVLNILYKQARCTRAVDSTSGMLIEWLLRRLLMRCPYCSMYILR